MKNKLRKYNSGGEMGIKDFIAPALSLIPGVGQFAPLLGMMLGGMNNTSSQTIGGKQLMGPKASPGIGNYAYGGPILPSQESTYVQRRPIQMLPKNLQPIPELDHSQLLEERYHEARENRVLTGPEKTIHLIRKAAENQALVEADYKKNPSMYPSRVQAAHPHDRLGGLGSSAKAKSKDRFRERNYGGEIDEQLSNNSFQVNGNPSVTDGNYYPEMNVKLDHNEVVKDNYVYSDAIKNALTGNTFAKDAEKLEKSTAKAEKRFERFGDAQAQNTIKHNNRQVEGLKKFQEIAAAAMGLRNEERSFEFGGPLPDGLDVGGFQLWYNKLPGVKPLKVDDVWGPQTEAAYRAAGAAFNNPNMSSTEGQFEKDPNRAVLPQIGFMAETKLVPNQLDEAGNPIDYSANPGLVNASWYDRVSTAAPTSPAVPEAMKEFSNQVSADRVSKYMGPKVSSEPRQYETPVTWGDALQGVEVASKFASLIGGAEQEDVNLDNTNLTRQSFDVNPQLYQSQRNLTNQMNSFDTSNINLRRALFNQAYAGKMNADAQTITNYQNMNNTANVQYQDRVSNQRRFNVGQQNYTDDINARNRGQFHTLRDNAFTSLGNFGEGLNQKVYANDSMRIYEEMYPKVAGRITSALSKDDLLKLLKLR